MVKLKVTRQNLVSTTKNIMKVFLLLLATSILGWQYLTVTSTLKSRIQERTNQIDYVINEYLGEI